MDLSMFTTKKQKQITLTFLNSRIMEFISGVNYWNSEAEKSQTQTRYNECQKHMAHLQSAIGELQSMVNILSLN